MKKYICAALCCFSMSVYADVYHGCTLDNPPLEIKSDQSGLLVELIEHAFNDAGHDVKVSFLPWSRCLKDVELGTKDFVFNAAKNAERQAYANYPEAVLFVEEYVFFKKKETQFTYLKDLSNIKDISLGVQRGYFYGDSIQKAMDDEKFKALQFATDIPQNIKKLMSGRTDIFIGDKVPTQFFLKKQGLADKVEVVVDEDGNEISVSKSPTYIAFSKKSTDIGLTKTISAAIEKAYSDGTYDKLKTKY